MSTVTAGRTGSTAGLGVARVVRLIATVVAAIIVVGILLIVLEANPSNVIVEAILDVARWLTTPFQGIFDLDGRKATVAVNWGLAAVVYFAIGALIAKVLAR